VTTDSGRSRIRPDDSQADQRPGFFFLMSNHRLCVTIMFCKGTERRRPAGLFCISSGKKSITANIAHIVPFLFGQAEAETKQRCEQAS